MLDLLKELNIEEETLLIVTSDHGESMTEYDLFFDHLGVYEPTIHMPLIIRWPQKLPYAGHLETL